MPLTFPDLPTPPPLRAADHQNDGKPHVLIASTGSVATIKLPLIVESLSHHDIFIRIIVTDAAAQFLQGQSSEQPALASLLEYSNVEAIYTDRDEWATPWTRGASILHIELRKWADIMVIAPLSANSLAKMANGFSDGLLMSVIRAWDTTGENDALRPGMVSSKCYQTERGLKPLVVFPAMNAAMWEHPVTEKHLDVLKEEWGCIETETGWIHVIKPMIKELACGDVGAGAMREWKEVVGLVESYLDIEQTWGALGKRRKRKATAEPE